MQTQAVSNNEYYVLLVSVENKRFYNHLMEQSAPLSPDTLRVSYSLALRISGEDEIDVEVGLEYGVENNTFSAISVSSHFKVVNLERIMSIDQETKQISFDESLLYVIIPVAFSTARGYFSAKLEGTPLTHFPFPIFKTDALIKNCRIMID